MFTFHIRKKTRWSGQQDIRHTMHTRAMSFLGVTSLSLSDT